MQSSCTESVRYAKIIIMQRLQTNRRGQRKQWVEEEGEPQPSPSVSKCPTREKSHYWLSVVNWEVSSNRDARRVTTEDSTEVVLREYLAKSLEFA